MGKLLYTKELKSLLKRPFFTPRDAEEMGIPRHALVYLAKKGRLERVSKGLYRDPSRESVVDFEWEEAALVAASIPQGVLCLISALSYHSLTDEIMREVWLAVPHRMKPPKRANVRVVRMRNIALGRTRIHLGEYAVQIFDRERCVVDAFRYLDKEIAIHALRAYLRDKPHLDKLMMYAKKMRVSLTPYIEALTL